LWDSEGFSCSIYLFGLFLHLRFVVLLRWCLICI